MRDIVFEALDDIFLGYIDWDPEEFEEMLAGYGLMIVPIEDPTNLMGPVDE